LFSAPYNSCIGHSGVKLYALLNYFPSRPGKIIILLCWKIWLNSPVVNAKSFKKVKAEQGTPELTEAFSVFSIKN
jgi:hypothetical protein